MERCGWAPCNGSYPFLDIRRPKEWHLDRPLVGVVLIDIHSLPPISPQAGMRESAGRFKWLLTQNIVDDRVR